MVKFLAAVLVNFLLVSAALAAPSSEASLQCRQSNSTEAPVKHTRDFPHKLGNWGGAIHNDGTGVWTVVSGIFTVPFFTGQYGSASAWVGIDGDTCQTATFYTGVNFNLTYGVLLYSAWSDWASIIHQIVDIQFSPGDVVRLTTSISSPTSGTSTIENLTTHKNISASITSQTPLCQQDASWVVKLFWDRYYLDPCYNLADFGTITFTEAFARTATNITRYPDTASTVDIVSLQRHILSSTSVSSNTVSVTYIPCA